MEAHYQRTALDWLANLDAHREEIERILRDVYGNETALWMRRWRWFFLATSGLFGHAAGSEWGVSQYRMKAAWARFILTSPNIIPACRAAEQSNGGALIIQLERNLNHAGFTIG